MKVERGIPSEELQPGKIPRFHIRYSPRFGLQEWNDGKLKKHFKEVAVGIPVDRIVVSDMSEVVVIFGEPRAARGTRGSRDTQPAAP